MKFSKILFAFCSFVPMAIMAQPEIDVLKTLKIGKVADRPAYFYDKYVEIQAPEKKNELISEIYDTIVKNRAHDEALTEEQQNILQALHELSTKLKEKYPDSPAIHYLYTKLHKEIA